MGSVINLGRARKQEKRLKKAAKASENATKFGRSAVQKKSENAAAIKAGKHLDGHKLADDDE